MVRIYENELTGALGDDRGNSNILSKKNIYNLTYNTEVNKIII